MTNNQKQVLILFPHFPVKESLPKLLFENNFFPQIYTRIDSSTVEICKLHEVSICIVGIETSSDGYIEFLDELEKSEQKQKPVIILVGHKLSQEFQDKLLNYEPVTVLEQDFTDEQMKQSLKQALTRYVKIEQMFMQIDSLEKEIAHRTTEFAMANQILASSQQRLNVVLNSLCDPICAIDTESNIVAVNTSFEMLVKKPFGVLAAEPLSRVIENKILLNFLINALENQICSIDRFTLKSDEENSDRIYKIKINNVKDDEDRIIGHTIVFLDQTCLHTSEKRRMAFLESVCKRMRIPLLEIKKIASSIIPETPQDGKSSQLTMIQENLEMVNYLINHILEISHVNQQPSIRFKSDLSQDPQCRCS